MRTYRTGEGNPTIPFAHAFGVSDDWYWNGEVPEPLTNTVGFHRERLAPLALAVPIDHLAVSHVCGRLECWQGSGTLANDPPLIWLQIGLSTCCHAAITFPGPTDGGLVLSGEAEPLELETLGDGGLVLSGESEPLELETLGDGGLVLSGEAEPLELETLGDGGLVLSGLAEPIPPSTVTTGCCAEEWPTDLLGTFHDPSLFVTSFPATLPFIWDGDAWEATGDFVIFGEDHTITFRFYCNFPELGSDGFVFENTLGIVGIPSGSVVCATHAATNIPCAFFLATLQTILLDLS